MSFITDDELEKIFKKLKKEEITYPILAGFFAVDPRTIANWKAGASRPSDEQAKLLKGIAAGEITIKNEAPKAAVVPVPAPAEHLILEYRTRIETADGRIIETNIYRKA